MTGRYVRSFASPDDIIEVAGVRSKIVDLGSIAMAHNIHQPGWRWKTNVGPTVNTEWCETRHVGYVLKGRLRVVTDDGIEFDLNAGDAFEMPPGHDSWVLGEEVVETIEWIGARSWMAPHHALRERVLASILFTDIVDSTATARRMGDRAWGDLIESHDQLVMDTVSRFRGRVVNPTGDGVLAVFDGAARAIRCAGSLGEAATGLGLSIRAAVHTGEIDLAGEEIHGVAIHEASRILGRVEGEEILVSAITRDLTRDAGLEFKDRGDHQLRGVGESLRLFAVRQNAATSGSTKDPGV